jgi:transcriptional regulator with XRE-family HTH domain
VTRHEISRYERGTRRPTGATLATIASTLDLPLPVLRQRIAEDRMRTVESRSEPDEPCLPLTRRLVRILTGRPSRIRSRRR